MKVSGIGGVIFKAKDPEALTIWYKKNLGIDRNKWEQTAGATAFAPMSAESDYFNKSQSFVLTFRVEGLKGSLQELEANGVKIIKRAENYENLGLFASIEDPEGNHIELWEPQDE